MGNLTLTVIMEPKTSGEIIASYLADKILHSWPNGWQNMGRRNSWTLLNVSTKFLFPTLKWKRLIGTYSILFWNDLVQLNGKKKWTTKNHPSEEGSSLKATKRTELLPHQLVTTVFWTADLSQFTSVTFLRRILTMFVSNVNHSSCRWSALISSRTSLIFNLTGFVCAIQ